MPSSSGPGEAMALFAVWLILAIASLSILIITAVWVYRDAQRRDDPQAAVWAVGSAIAWPIVLIVYLLVRDQRQRYPRY